MSFPREPREIQRPEFVADSQLSEIQNEKKRLRLKHLALRDKINGPEALQLSSLIRNEIRAGSFYQQATCVSSYISTRSEVINHGGILRCIEAGKIICVPKVFGNELRLFRIRNMAEDLAPGTFGVLEPLPHCEEIPLDMPTFHVIPGVVFDLNGNRIGYGKGYYDRFLKKLPPSAVTVGLAFDCQVLDSIPTEPTDVPLQYLITPERGWIKCGKKDKN